MLKINLQEILGVITLVMYTGDIYEQLFTEAGVEAEPSIGCSCRLTSRASTGTALLVGEWLMGVSALCSDSKCTMGGRLIANAEYVVISGAPTYGTKETRSLVR